jgi:enoyl-CoA hydratase
MDDLVPPRTADIDYETAEPVTYNVEGRTAWVMMNRPKYHNVQNSQMTYALDEAFQRAVADDNVKVIVLGGEGKHFSAGHDIGTPGRDVAKTFDRKLLLADHVNKSIWACAAAGATFRSPPSPWCKAAASLAGLCSPGCVM